MENIINAGFSAIFPDIRLNIFNNLIAEIEEELAEAKKDGNYQKISELATKAADLRTRKQRYLDEQDIQSPDNTKKLE